jgi:branched-chain amino acid transport system permease protein
MDIYLAQTVNGLANGMVIFLIASGLTLIYGMMGVLNLAHASFFMLSAYIGYQILSITNNFWLSIIFAPIITAIIGIGLERFILRRVHKYGHVNELILTMGISLVILELIKMFWGSNSMSIAIPSSSSGLISLFGFEYPVYRYFIIGLSLLIVVFLFYILYRTRLGLIVRATVSDSEMVKCLGINVPLVYMFVFGIGTWLAGMAGVVIAPILTVYPGLADQVGMDAFIIVVAGGFGSVVGALICSIGFGLLNAYGIVLFPQIAPVLIYFLLAIILIVRPNGLFGRGDE